MNDIYYTLINQTKHVEYMASSLYDTIRNVNNSRAKSLHHLSKQTANVEISFQHF